MLSDWDHLKVALAVGRAGSLTAAATLLGMDQTTVGRRLTALETHLGAPLFIRSKSGFSTTEAGQIVLENVVEHRQISSGGAELLDETHDEAVGVLRIMGNPWMLQRLAERFLPQLLQDHPRLEIRLSGRLPPAPIHAEPTVSLWFDAEPHPPDMAIPFCRVPYASYQAASGTDETSTWVQFQDDVARGPSFSRQLRKRMKDDARVRLTATDAQMLRGAVRAGVAKGVLPICLGDHDPLLERVPEQAGVIQRMLHLHASEEASRIRRVGVFRNQLADAAAELFDGALLASARA